jgi:hypothetical protein
MLALLQEVTTKDWLLVLAGSGLSGLGAFAKYVVTYWRQYNQITPLLGTWHTYHWSRRNHQSVFRRARWSVKRTLLRVRVTSEQIGGEMLPCRGRVTFESGQVLFTFQGERHRETIFIRLNDPIQSDDTSMRGVLLAQDFEHEIYATMKLCLKKDKSEEEVKALLRNYSIFDHDDLSLRIGVANKQHRTKHRLRGAPVDEEANIRDPE